MPKGLPRSKAVHAPEFLPDGAPPRRSESPDPLPASFRALWEDTQTVPEDTQTVPEDTQTVPEDTQTVPENTQPGSGAAPVPIPSSPDLGAPPGGARPSLAASVPRSSASLGGNPARLAPPAPVATSVFELSSARAQAIAKMAKDFDASQHKRLLALDIRRKRQGGRPLLPEDDLIEEDAAHRAEARERAAGLPKKIYKKKVGLDCQPGRPHDAASKAILDVTAYLWATGAFATRPTALFRSIEAYDRAYEALFPGIAKEEAIPQLIGAICDRISLGRSVSKRNIRGIIESTFRFRPNPSTQAEIDANIKIYLSIRDKFHFGSLTDPGTHYENPMLETAFVKAFFYGSHAACAAYHQYFKPRVPPQTIGALLTLIDTCIAEWRTGRCVEEQLNVKHQAVTYKKHMANLAIFAEGAPARFRKMRGVFYRAGVRLALGAIPNAEEPDPATIRASDVRPDSPGPMSGSDAEDGLAD